MLDEAQRRRVARLAGGDPGQLDDAARERIIEKLRRDGPALVRRARRVRFATMSAGPLLAAAAVAALIVNERGRGGPELLAPPAVAASASGCAAKEVPAGAARGFVAGASGSRLDLGETALAVSAPGAGVRLVSAAPCRTVIGLDSGSVTVHAKALRGGELRVDARDGQVTVRGTLFGVTQASDSLVVEVLEGRVSVRARGSEHEVGAGERFSLSALGVGQGALAAERAEALRQAVGAPKIVGFESLPAAELEKAPAEAPAPRGPATPVVGPARSEASPPPVAMELESEATAPPPVAPAKASSVDLLARADEARHAGNFAEARRLYRQVADGRDATAEAAWVALARMELSLGHGAQAREATRERQARFGQGALAPEALWIDVRAHRQAGETARAKELAADLVRRWPSSPQARAAEHWLSGP